MSETMIPVPGRLHSVASEGHVAGADEIYDDTQSKLQSTINSEVISALEDKYEKPSEGIPTSDLASVGVANGLATLDSTGKLDSSQMPAVDSFPSQSGQSGKFLTTDGTDVSWGSVPNPTVDQNYSASSTNAQSGTAVAEAISGKANASDVAGKANKIGTTFDTETAYVVGDYVTYDSKLWKCTTDHSAGAWNAEDFTEVTGNVLSVDGSGDIKESGINITSLSGKADKIESNPFSDEEAYAVNDYVTYSGNLYKCTTAHEAGEWNSSDFTLVTDNFMAIDANGNIKDSGIAKEDVMQKDGYSKDLHAGLADNIVGEFSDEAEVSFRPTAGAVDIESGKADKGAKITGIKGNTRAWNQPGVVSSYGGTTVTTDGNISRVQMSPMNTSCGFCFIDASKIVDGHKFYMSFELIKGENDTTTTGFIGNFTDGGWFSFDYGQKYTFIKRLSAYNVLWKQGESGNVLDAYIKNLLCIDLTLIYGSGNEPATAAEFEADYQRWFGKPLTYEEYDEGSLRPVKMTGLKTTGFNAWDEEWEVGGYNESTGEKTPYENSIRCKNLIKILPSTMYHIKSPANTNFLNYYDIEGNWLRYGGMKTGYVDVITPSDAHYMSIWSYNYGTTYNHDICISLNHSGDRDGEYEPYWSSLLNVPITTMKGKLNGTGSSIVVFPDGLKKAGTVYDEIVRRGDKTYGIKRLGSYTFTGEEGWTYWVNNIFYIDNLDANARAKAKGKSIIANPIGFKIYSGYGYRWTVINSSYSHDATGAAQIRDALAGYTVYYELETPEEYLLDDFELPQEYDVDDYGTEEVQLGTGGIAPVLDIKYGINAPDTIKNLPHSYVSAVGEQDFTEAQQARARKNIDAASRYDIIRLQDEIDVINKKGETDYWVDLGLPSGTLWAKRNIDVTRPDGFATSPYQYECSFFSWGNTDGHNPSSESSFAPYSWGTDNDTEPYVSSPGAALTGNIGLSNDAAHVNIGGNWRMPTTEEYAELFNNTKFIDANGDDIPSTTANKLITFNGVVGIRLKSTANGREIFFPCSGNGNGTSWNDRGSVGYYWASSLYSATNNSYNLNFTSGGVNPQHNIRRFCGLPVRPVM